MNKMIIALATAAAVLVTAGTSSADDFQAGGQPKLKVSQVQMGIKSPKLVGCPTTATMMVWVFTNKAGKVPIYVARQGATGVSGPYMVQTKATGNGKFMGTYSKVLNIHQSVDTKYRASAPNFQKLSNWVPLKAKC